MTRREVVTGVWLADLILYSGVNDVNSGGKPETLPKPHYKYNDSPGCRAVVFVL